jgi:thioesterase domain-containing protein/aryl carrier-like protein
LAALDGVEQAVVIAREDGLGVKRLVGYVTGTVDPIAARGALARRLPGYLVPSAVVAIEALPMTVNGKLDTRALPEPERPATGYRAPSGPTEELLADLYGRVLGADRVGADDSFFDLGGDSITAMRLVAAVNGNLSADVTVPTVFEAPTVRELAHRLRSDAGRSQAVPPVQVLGEGSGAPLFCIHAASGLSWPYRALADHVDRPMIGLQQTRRHDEPEPRSIRDMAVAYADRIVGVVPDGPYDLLGWSFGGVIAHEVGIELRRRGAPVRLAMLDAQPRMDRRVTAPVLAGALGDDRLAELITSNARAGVELYREHEPGVFDGDVLVFSAERAHGERGDALRQAWRPHVAGDVVVHPVDCTHDDMLTAQAIDGYAAQLGEWLVNAGVR